MTPYPEWLYVVSVVAIATAVACAIVILIHVLRRPQQMTIMDVVWPLTALYWGPLAVWAYLRVGEKTTHEHHEAMTRTKSRDQMEREKRELQSRPPTITQAAVGVSHCGAGCTLGDIIGEVFIAVTGITWFGGLLPTRLVVDFVLAWMLGVVFQYFTIVPMRHLSMGKGIAASIKADTVSIVAFQVGMSIWMLLTYYVFFPGPHLTAGDPVFWFMMQIAMIVGYATSYPANRWLLKAGVKERMPDMPDAAFGLDRAIRSH